MDWCSYVLESLVKECTVFRAFDKFIGPLLLLALSSLYLLEFPAFKAWNSNLLLKRQQEELDLKGFGLLPIVKGLEFIEPKKVNKKKKLKSITEDEYETVEKVEQKEDFHYKTFEEMKKNLKDNLLKRRNLMEDTDNKLDTASDDEELKNIIKKRNELFVTLYKNNEALRNVIEKRNKEFVTLYKDEIEKVEEDDEDKDRDLEKDDDDKEKDEVDDDDAPDGDNDDKGDDDKDENNDENDDDDETDGDNDDNDEDDDDENDDNDENDENIRNEKENKGGSDNVEDDNVEEGITDVEQKIENVEEEKEKKKVPDDMVWDQTKAIVPFDDYHDYVIKLESKKIRDPSLVVHQMIEDITKLPLISSALKESTYDIPPIDARPSFNKIKFKLNRDSDGKLHAKNIDDVSCASEKGIVYAVEVPAKKVVNAAKDKTVKVTKKEVPKKIILKAAVKTSAKAVEVPHDKVVDTAKKKDATMTPFKQPRPTTKIIKDDYQTPKRGKKRVAQVLEDDVVLSGKHMVNPSFALVSPYFERKTMYTKPFFLVEKKIAHYIWSYNSPEG
ncbi:hypothetical protein Tco_0493896 [Tanacetum coccineum]